MNNLYNAYAKSANKVIGELRTSSNGLTNQQVLDRQKTGLKNRFEEEKKQSFVSKFFAQFKDLMVIVLIISAAISITLALVSKEYQNLFEGGIIVFIVILNATLGVMQESKAENALENLKKQSEPFCDVLRDGKLQSVKVEDIVVGDLVILSSGNILPADVRLVETYNFKVNESSLTGESLDVEKNANVVLSEHTPLGERKNMAYKSSVVSYGRAIGVVTAIGKDTEMGKIAVMISNAQKELTPLQKSLNKIGKIISISVIIISVIIFMVEMTIPKSTNLLEAFLTAVALAVAAIPESLPASITIIMALGVQRLAKQNAIIKRLHAVETLGSCSVICSDKTGTLTQNKMQVKNIYFNQNMVSVANHNDSVKRHFKQIINCMVLCNDCKLIDGSIYGEPTEAALFSYVMQTGANINDIILSNKRESEIPFDSERKIMSTINQTPNGLFCYSKGALDFLIKKCSKILINGNIETLSQQRFQEIETANKEMAEKALRVLCLAYKPIDTISQNDIENGLVFLGLVGLIDPPREEVYDAIKKCRAAGLKPVMITGDHAETAFAIAKELGIASSRSQVLTGLELSKIEDSKLSNMINNYSVFARVSPEHKVKIVKAFKKLNKIVAMTGDGVNDAPSLKIADIGIGMGISGTDVTKDVADMIVSDDNFATIVVAVEEGRKIYSNIQRTIQFLLSTNAVEVFTLLITSLFLPQFTFLLPAQLLFINFITDSLPAISLGLEPAEIDIMKKPPRDSNENIISIGVWTKILYEAAIQIVIVISLYVIGINHYDAQTASTLAFFCINIMQLLHAVNLKTSHSIFKTNIFKNKLFNFSFVFSIILVLLVAFVSPLTFAFGLVPLDSAQWLLVLGFSISIIPLVEIAKLVAGKFQSERVR